MDSSNTDEDTRAKGLSSSDTDEDTRAKRVYSDEWVSTYNWVKPSKLGKSYAFCSVCNISFCIQHSGQFDLRRHQKLKTHIQNQRKVSCRNTRMDNSVSCSVALMQFIQTLNVSKLSGKNDQVSHDKTKLVLGPHYPGDITSVCKTNPYCVYLYGQVAVADGHQTLVVLVGFFDEKAGKHRIRFLDAFLTTGNSSEEAVVSFLKETFKKFDLPSHNLCAFYMDGLGETTEKMVSFLKQLSPHIVSLGGLYSLPDSACHAALTEHFHEAKELIMKIHAHYTTISSGDDNLKELFADVHELDQSLSAQNTLCRVFLTLVRRVVGMWQELVTYFSKDTSGKDKNNLKEICVQLRNPKLRLTFIFLDKALEPLRTFQDRLETRNGTVRADLVQILREASGLLRAFASNFLKPQAVMRFLRERDAALLTNLKFYLPTPEQNLGGTAVEDFLVEYEEDMVDYVEAFQSKCVSFYATLTGSLAEGLPLSDGVLRSMSQLLSPKGRLKVTGKAVVDIGVQLGLANTPGESLDLTDEFLEYQLVEEQKEETNASSGKNGSEDGADNSLSTLSLEEHWSTYLKTIDAQSTFRKLMLSLLALPCPPLEAEKVFAQAAGSIDVCHSDANRVSDTDGSHSAIVNIPRSDGKKRSPSSKNGDLIYLMRPCKVSLQRMTKLDLTENKVVVVDEDSFLSNTECGDAIGRMNGRDSSLRRKPAARTIFQASTGTWCEPKNLEEEPEGPRSAPSSPSSVYTPEDDWAESESEKEHASNRPEKKAHMYQVNAGKMAHMYQDGHGFSMEELAWGKGKDIAWWPCLVVTWKELNAPVAMRRVEWFGDGTFSEINTGDLQPFAAFAKCFCTDSCSSSRLYKNAIYQSLELASERCERSFSADSKDDEMKAMLQWALGGFLPDGPEGFLPPSKDKADARDSDSSLSDYQPPVKRKYTIKNRSSPQPQGRGHIFQKVSGEGESIENFCISCGSMDVEVKHPLFEGGLCEKCTRNFSETLFRYDDDGYQSYCTVCCYGHEVLLCSNTSCCRCFCKDCLDCLVGPGTFEHLKDVDPWSCYMCLPSERHGVLKLRVDWSVRVQEFFANNSDLQFEPHRVYQFIPAHQRRPIKVLSLFDGIATGLVVLKELGFNIELYLAAEICGDAVAVGMTQHDGKIGYIDDVRSITRRNLAEWGPFDLLIGGSPCNDLCTVNPHRKGLFEGTGRLFFEYYRMLTMMRPREGEDRPFFWLFENVVAMTNNDRNDICRFLECNPVLLDAVHVSAAHRARYFWGNIPGMSRPMVPSSYDRVNLQDCLETGRIAKFTKVKTITTQSSSIRQGRSGTLPVMMNGEDDYLWCTEMEKVFGFPKHYTDVADMGRVKRQILLGKSWSVPVVRHLLAPLKDYFACE